jgi:hypothetical protein
MISLRIKIFNFFLHFAFITLPLCVQSQIIVKQLDLKNIPNGIKDEGKIKSAFSWIDTLGVNIVTLSETGIHRIICESFYFKG